jgi:pyruvate/2-oxoglutarate dehydrogenase complex dihydrolipoamide acyltransferase (E2) component
MADRLFMIALSPTMEEGTILKWKVKEGDTFEAGTPLCEVETDKASMDYEAAEDGTLLKIIMGEGDGAKVGDTIAIFGEAGKTTPSFWPKSKPNLRPLPQQPLPLRQRQSQNPLKKPRLQRPRPQLPPRPDLQPQRPPEAKLKPAPWPRKLLSRRDTISPKSPALALEDEWSKLT